VATLAAAGVIASQRVVRPDEPGEGERGRLVVDRSGLALIVAAGLFSGAAESISVVLGAWFEDSFTIAVGAIAGLSALLGLFELSGSSLTALITDRLGKKRAVLFGLSTGAVCYVAMGLAQDSLVFGVGAAALGFAAFEFTIVSTYPLASEAAPNARARYLAWLVVALNAGRTVAAFFGTRLFVSAGFRANAFTSAAVNLVAIGILAWFVVERPAQPAAASTD
jgi:predicted MFS family arabinose efflux permease